MGGRRRAAGNERAQPQIGTDGHRQRRQDITQKDYGCSLVLRAWFQAPLMISVLIAVPS